MSPRSGFAPSGKGPRLARAITTAPPTASSSPPARRRVGRSPNRSQAATATITGVRLESTVALATLV